MGERPKDIKEILADAASKTTAQERAVYLDAVCSSDTALRSEVESLLRMEQEVGDFLEVPPLDASVTWNASPLSEGPGMAIGRYKLLEKIGEGGMAVVYMAEQAEPLRRKVALKIIKLGMDTKQVIARFEAERQALAMMDHPNIAKVFDAGATETGRPYFVMELVTGVSITEYCDKNNLTTRDRVALFVQVCNAVQHAHQKGVIHRDIKPSNVMVRQRDGEPVPKVIDFGIAKATNQKLTEKTLFTRYAHIIGTPAYMSPEQAELSDVDIDTRSDIYSLGVLLYELLTGTTPFSEEELREAGYVEMQRVIREEEPAKPSTKLSTLGETLTDVAKRRGCTPDLLTRTVRGDLDWIVMKALEKDRSRRYEGASALALDIERYVEHRPVSAHAPSTTYCLWKLLRRNRLQAAAILAATIVVVAITVLFIRNRYQVRLAEAEGARQARVLSDAHGLVAKGRLAEARKLLRPILESQHVGLDARNLFANTLIRSQEPDEALEGAEAVMNRHYRERVQHYTKRIQADPTDPDNYLQRAQQFQYLRDEENVNADMSRYAILLGRGQFSRARLGPSRIAELVTRVLSRCRLVFHAGRPENRIVLAFIAFGQKGGFIMKPFEVPMFLTSLFALCLSPGLEVRPAHADIAFGEPVNLRSIIPLIDPAHESIDCLSSDGFEMYIESDRAGGRGNFDGWVLRRSSVHEDWGLPENLGTAVNSSAFDAAFAISEDGLTLHFHSTRSVGHGSTDIYVTTRPTKDAPWSQAANIGPPINSSAWDGVPWMSPDGLELYFTSRRTGGQGGADGYVTRRASRADPWGEAENLGPALNSPYDETNHNLSPDGLLLFFSDNPWADTHRPGGYGGCDMWMTRRASLSSPWVTPVNMGRMVNSFVHDVMPRFSPDGTALYFVTNSGNAWENWRAPILPMVDFNGDGTADGKDVVILTEHWGKSDSVCDIGPYAWGDGIVDEQDLFVLAEYLPGDVNDPTLVAHWGLDETEGAVAHDCVGDCDAMVMGDAAWQPDGGVFGGALALDGVDDCLVTDPVPELSAGPFSILAWVKGGTPDEVILSGGAADWLYTNPADGSLMTALSSVAGNGVPLFSDVAITDGRWHRIGLVWDGTSRILLVDEQEVARDEQAELAISDNGLIIGAGAAANRFFSGQMDDIRIYRRAVKP